MASTRFANAIIEPPSKNVRPMVVRQLRQIVVYPGQSISFQDVNWDEFEAIVTQLGESRNSRVAYYDRTLELRLPLPKHEKAKVLLGNMVTILLEELEIDNECFGSTTFKRKDLGIGVEPNDCFYIQNAVRMLRFDRLFDNSIYSLSSVSLSANVT